MIVCNDSMILYTFPLEVQATIYVVIYEYKPKKNEGKIDGKWLHIDGLEPMQEKTNHRTIEFD